MPDVNLPPLLARSYATLVDAPHTAHRRAVLAELSAVSDALNQAVTRGLSAREFDELKIMRSGITAGGDEMCPCCQQPYKRVG